MSRIDEKGAGKLPHGFDFATQNLEVKHEQD